MFTKQGFSLKVQLANDMSGLNSNSANGQPLKPATGKTGRLERTVRALFVQNQQAGHLMC
jgi:hypothetical protein